MVNQDLVKYLTEGRRRGFGLALLKKKLLEGGFEEDDIEEAIMALPVEPIVSDKSTLQKPLIKKSLSTQPTSSIPNSDKLSFFKKVNMTLVKPRLLFEKTDADSIKPTLGFQELLAIIPFLITVAGIMMLLSFVVASAPPGSLLGLFLAGISTTTLLVSMTLFAVALFVIWPLMMFVSAGITHLFVTLMKGQGHYRGTYKAMVYAVVPSFIVTPFASLISLVGAYGSLVSQILLIIVGIWSFVLLVIGMKSYHKCSTIKAFFMVLLGMIFTVMLTAALVLGAALLSPQPPQFGFSP